MSKFNLSDIFLDFLNELSKSEVFLQAQYYMRSLKKAPHGGVFHTKRQCDFLKYYPVQTYAFLPQGRAVPYPISICQNTVELLIKTYNISTEELLEFCFCVDLEDNTILFGKEYAGDRIYSATASGVLTLKNQQTHSHDFYEMIQKAVNGEIKFLDYFDCNFSRLLEIFLLWCVKIGMVSFSRIEDICAIEQLDENRDKYGLSNITCADFERQGFTIDDRFFLYNVFLDTSIGNISTKVPKTIEVIKKYSDDSTYIFMRKDGVLSVPRDKKVTSATTDMQKLRGITLNLENLEAQIKFGKNVIVHYCPKTMHKVVVVIKPSETCTHEKFYNITVEQLWSPNSLCASESVVLTNFVHGCYYPSKKSFDHLDYSVNQYDKDIFLKKYQDSISSTSVSIEQYSSMHYKVWCIKGNHLSLKLWAELTICTLDEPFREIFAETIGVEIDQVE